MPFLHFLINPKYFWTYLCGITCRIPLRSCILRFTSVDLDIRRYLNVGNNRGQHALKRETKYGSELWIQCPADSHTTKTGLKTISDYTFIINMEGIFAGYSAQQLSKFTGFSLRNYYRYNHEKGTTRCLLCKINIEEDEMFEHTRSTSHDYNKQFQHFVRTRNVNGGMDFMDTKNSTCVQCRYCNNVRFSKGFPRLQGEHIRSVMHSERKKYCLDRITGGPNKFAIPHNSKSKPIPCEQTRFSSTYERRLVAEPNKEIRLVVELHEVKNLEKKLYRLNATTGKDQKITIPQRLPNPPESSRTSVSRPVETHRPTVGNIHQLRVGPSRTLRETERLVDDRIHATEESEAGPKRKFFGFMSRKSKSKSENPRESKLRLRKICKIC